MLRRVRPVARLHPRARWAACPRLSGCSDESADHSPAWYGWLLLDLLLFGVLVIVLNYLQVLPGSVSPWYLAGGLASMFAAFYLATRYR